MGYVPRPVNEASFQHLRSMICRAIACLSLSSATVLSAQEIGAPIVTAFSNAEMGNDTRVWTATQDASGLLYFGADSLVSFDGARWRTTPIEGAYVLRGLEFASENQLWVAADRNIGWFARDADNAWTFHSLLPQLPFPAHELGEMWQVFAEKNGALFIAENKILRWDGKAFHVWPMAGADPRLFACRSGGVVYVHHKPTGIYAIGPEGPSLVIPASVVGNVGVMWVQPSDKGWLLVSGRGLFHYTDGKLEAFGPEASAFISDGNLTCVVPLPHGELAIGTLRGGLAFVGADGSLRSVLTEGSGLPTSSVYSLFLDREENLWGTSASYLFHLPLHSDSTLFDQRAGLPPRPLYQVARRNNETFVVTENGAYSLAASGASFRPIELIRDQVRDMRATPNGLLLARRRSIALLANGAIKNLVATTQQVYLAKYSRIFPEKVISSVGRSIMMVDPDGTSRVLAENLPDIATSLAEDAQGRVWFGSFAAGVFIVQPHPDHPAEATPPPETLGLPKLHSHGAVIAAKDGSIIVLAPEGGWILGPKADRFRAIENYPARRTATYFYLSADDSLWVIHGTSRGRPAAAGRIALLNGTGSWQPHSIDGLGEIGAPRCFIAEKNAAGTTVLWIGGMKGLLRSEAPDGPFAPVPRAPLLHGYSRAGEAAAFHSISNALPYATQSVRFEFAAPEFSGPPLRLETFIDGIDHDWVPADATTSRELTAVRDGRYIFRVRAVAETGLASAPAEFHFEILAPWWRTTPAIIGVVLALLPGAYGVYRLRVRALRRRNAELEEKVGQRTEQLAKASAAKTEFVANMSHDIRNPLNGIVGLALALEDTRLDPRQREIVATLRECGTYLSSLVDDVLDFATIEAGQVELRPGPFAAAELLRSVATTLKGDAAEQGATILIEVDPKLPPTIVGDAGRIQQILVNYASNAVKYAGGTIRLIARMPAESPGEIEFTVADQGPGLTETETAALFTKFTRLPSARHESIKGAGLGLAACRSLADIMGGSVGVESQPGVGSKFFLRLPLVISQPRETNSSFSLPAARVLLVEDADYNAWAAAAVLTKLNLPHERARTGEEALRMFAEKRFDVVLLDRNLPDMDGTEVAKRIREFEADTTRAILLAVTAYCTAEDRALCLAAGMDAFVGKPLTPEKLRRVLLAAGRRLLAAASVQVSTEPTAATPAPAVDVSLLNYLSDGTEEGLGEQIERFLATLSKVEDQLEHAASARDFAAVAATSHQMLSQAKMVGAFALDSAATALENAARREDQAAFGPLLEQLRHDSAALKAALRRHRSETHST